MNSSNSSLLKVASTLGFLAFSLTSALPASARNLVEIDRSVVGNVTIYVDRDSIQYWEQTALYDIEITEYAANGAWVSHIRETLLADCSKYIYQPRSLEIFVDHTKGIQNEYVEYNDSKEIESPAPGSLGYSALAYVCS